MYPVFHIEKITRKERPIYPTTIVGKPPMEDCYLGKATERIFLPLMKMQCPEIVDIDFPLEGVFHNCAIVSIKKAFPLHANKVLYSLWGLGQMMYTKNIVIVDEGVNVHDYNEVLKEIIKNVTFENHLVITEGPLDALDHASDRPHQGYRLGIDACKKLDKEPKGKELSFDDFDRLINGENSPVKIIKYNKKEKDETVKEYLNEISSKEMKFIVVVDEWIDNNDLSTVAWKIFNNIDPDRDTVIKMRNDGSLFVGIDATRKVEDDGFKRNWPDDIEMADKIIDLVDKRWPEYGIDKSK
jgi:4-hydroxy-3-polyprenylbenzoate decarboxylase